MRDLGGSTFILTRAPSDNAPLAAALGERGARVIELPCIRVRPATDVDEVGRRVRALGKDDWLVVTSRAGARAVAAALAGAPLRAPLAVVGPATERAAREVGLAADFRPSRADTEALGEELPVTQGVVVLARSDRATPDVADRLRARGARVSDVVVYRISVAAAASTTAAARQACERGAFAVLASPSGVEGFARLVGVGAARGCRLIAIGRTTAARIRQALEREPSVAARPEHDAILAAIGNATVPTVPAARDGRSPGVSA